MSSPEKQTCPTCGSPSPELGPDECENPFHGSGLASSNPTIEKIVQAVATGNVQNMHNAPADSKGHDSVDVRNTTEACELCEAVGSANHPEHGRTPAEPDKPIAQQRYTDSNRVSETADSVTAAEPKPKHQQIKENYMETYKPSTELFYVIESDGDSWFAHYSDFTNVAESDEVAFGTTPQVALQAFIDQRVRANDEKAK